MTSAPDPHPTTGTTHPPATLIVGPTAGGKSSLAMSLARRARDRGIDTEIVSADSMQIYRGMDIGTAKPTEAERAEIPHHLIDIREPTESFSVHEWLALTEATLDELRAAGKAAIVVGGTHLYAKALLEGLFVGPEPDPGLRAELEAIPPHERRAELERVDPSAGARIHPNDDRRTIRALEVYRQTGIPISTHQHQWDAGRTRRDLRLVGLDWAPELVNRRINARVRAMIDAGLVDEVRALWHTDRLGPQAREALGYKHLIDHLAGRATLDDAIERIKIDTRRLAKNQRTWLRRLRTTPGSVWINAADTPPEHWPDHIF
ncbi:MAG: tRNA (adenosine(37)-N6)-dimethylallyltransferase MiaA [Planctomycetota bacterium]